MFTKTMAVQVWKPEHERPGRHFVYTTRYTRFFVDLLEITGDKVNFELLAKRVRKKPAEFYEHSQLWQELCTRYLRMLHSMGKVHVGLEDSAFKSVNHEEFSTLAMRLEAWCQNPLTQHPVLDVLRDALELKRLNNGLMKPQPIDDLIGDTYALLYTTIGPTLPPLPSEQQPQATPSATPAPLAPAQFTPHAAPVSSYMPVQVDGAHDPNNASQFAIYHPNQLQTQPLQPPQAEVPTKPRAKAIGRREIGRRADACVQKPVPIASTPTQNTSTAMPIRSPPILNAPPPSFPTRTSSPDKSAQPEPTADESFQRSFDHSAPVTAAPSVHDNDQDNEQDEGENEHEHDHDPSAPTSVHDDADDESELSELDEEAVEEMEHEVRRSVSMVTVAAKHIFSKVPTAGEGNKVKGGDTIRVRVPTGVRASGSGNGSASASGGGGMDVNAEGGVEAGKK